MKVDLQSPVGRLLRKYIVLRKYTVVPQSHCDILSVSPTDSKEKQESLLMLSVGGRVEMDLEGGRQETSDHSYRLKRSSNHDSQTVRCACTHRSVCTQPSVCGGVRDI